MAASQDAVATAPTNLSSQDTDTPESAGSGQDFTRPQNLFQLRDSYRTAPGTTRPVTTDTLTLRADRWFDLAPQWLLAFRADLPFVAKNPVNSDDPDGHFLYGLGNADAQAALIHMFDLRWAAGLGIRLIAPTGQDDVASKKWQLMPIVGVRAMLPEIASGSYFMALARYDLSVAGDPSAKTISNLQLAPTLNLSLPDRWFITLYPNPDIRVNFGDPSLGRLGVSFCHSTHWALPSEVRIANEFFEPNRRPETETQTAGEHRGASPLSPRTHQCKPEFLLGPCLRGTQQSAYATQRWEN